MKILERKSGNQNAVDVVKNLDIKDVQDVEYMRFNIGLPMQDADIAKTFGEEFDLGQDFRHVPGGVDHAESSLVMNGILQQDTLVVGLRFHAFADAESFVVRGKTTGGKPALFEYGLPAWRALASMVHAYGLRFQVSQRYLLVDDPLSQILFLKQPESFKRDPMEEREVVIKKHVEELNARLQRYGAAELFVPESFVTKISPIDKQFVGIGATEPFYKLPKKALLPAGIPMGLLLNAHDMQALGEMQSHLSASEGKGGASVPSDDVTVFRAGRIRLDFGLMGCVVPRGDMLNQLLEMEDVLDVCGRSTSALNEIHRQRRTNEQ